MPSLLAISSIDFPDRVAQHKVKEYARAIFQPSFPQIDRIIGVFDSTGIVTRNFCQPLSYYGDIHGFKAQNDEYIRIALEYSVRAVQQCMDAASLDASEITDILYVSTTGLSTPSIDALIINRMRLNPNINRTPVFGLGCAGGVGGFSKAATLAVANPNAIVLLVCVELCSLTFLRNDYSKSNLVGASLFADGVAACIIAGDNRKASLSSSVNYLGSQSKLYYDTLDVMGWQFHDSGFKVLFSQDIPVLISDNIKSDVCQFLKKYNLSLSDIKNFIFHPGGRKVLAAYEASLQITPDQLRNTREVMYEYGNMSSATVLYVLERYCAQRFEDGYGLMLAMGPGFSSEMALLEMKSNS